MRVLHVIDALGVSGGAEHSLVVQVPLLKERGIESVIAVLHDRKGRPIGGRYGLLGRTKTGKARRSPMELDTENEGPRPFYSRHQPLVEDG